MTPDTSGRNYEPLCGAIGHIIVNWTFVDTALSTWCAIVYHSVGGKHREPELPRNTSRKLTFLRRCFRRIDALKPYQAEALATLDAAERLAETRNFVAHGSISEYDESAHLLTIIKMDPVDGYTVHKVTELKITFEALLDIGNACMDLAATALDFGERLMDEFVREQEAHKPTGRV